MTPVYFGPRSSPLQNATVGRFVCELIWQKAEAIRDYCTMGVFDGDKLVAGTVYHNWHPETGIVELTSASLSKRWLTRNVVNAMFELPFQRLGCQMVVLRVSEANDNMVCIARSFGFDEHFIPRLGGRDKGEYIFTLTDDQWSSSKFRKSA
ncbi:N-acetyltransferase [Tardiphaga sp. 367_B4_N1_1]|uniref:N-acetyltransferase n=1 Tax=Tardiphaga sp. 367_B4_N1_1 TaxID=3240777 RepID=UPI003F291998